MKKILRTYFWVTLACALANVMPLKADTVDDPDASRSTVQSVQTAHAQATLTEDKPSFLQACYRATYAALGALPSPYTLIKAYILFLGTGFSTQPAAAYNIMEKLPSPYIAQKAPPNTRLFECNEVVCFLKKSPHTTVSVKGKFFERWKPHLSEAFLFPQGVPELDNKPLALITRAGKTDALFICPILGYKKQLHAATQIKSPTKKARFYIKDNFQKKSNLLHSEPHFQTPYNMPSLIDPLSTGSSISRQKNYIYLPNKVTMPEHQYTLSTCHHWKAPKKQAWHGHFICRKVCP